MPYIRPEFRTQEARYAPTTAGELNYAITCLVLGYCATRTRDYQTMNDVVGALEGAKLEFYRRVVVDYENEKIKQNGDVYPK
jgi:hypothetical protein